MKRICKNCEWWVREKNLGSCNCGKFIKGYWPTDKDIQKDECWVEDDEGWAFQTGELFGCVHFENKQLEEPKQNGGLEATK